MNEQIRPKRKIGCFGIAGIAVGAIILLGIIISVVGGKNGNVNKSLSSAGNSSNNTANKSNEITNNQPKIEFKNVMLQSQLGLTNVVGEAVNNDTKAHSFTLKVSFYDTNKKLLGTAVGAVNDVNGGEIKIFTAMSTGDYSKAASFKVDVDTIVSTAANKKSPIDFSNTVVNYQAGNTTIDGEAKNNDSKEHSFTLVVAFYDSSKKLIGTATGAVNNLAGGATKTFSAITTGDYSKVDSYIVQVDTLVS